MRSSLLINKVVEGSSFPGFQEGKVLMLIVECSYGTTVPPKQFSDFRRLLRRALKMSGLNRYSNQQEYHEVVKEGNRFDQFSLIHLSLSSG